MKEVVKVAERGTMDTRRISFITELGTHLGNVSRRTLRSMRSLFISLLFPVVAAFITIFIAGENMFVHYEGTKSACFVLVCAAIWGGMFNSVQIIVGERAEIKRGYVGGSMRLSCYVLANAIVQLILCVIQSVVLCGSLYGVEQVWGNEFGREGLLLENTVPEYYITILLVMYAADTMGILISSLVKKSEVASVMAPYILIVQLIFSGILFTLNGFAANLSAVMLSRWGMEALGSISNLNAMPLRLQAEFPALPHEAEDAFLYTTEHLWNVWRILTVFVVVPLVLSVVVLRGVKNDTRE